MLHCLPTLLWHLFIAVFLIPGYTYPFGYVRRPQGVREELTEGHKIKKTHPNEASLSRFFYLGVHKGDTSLIWWDAEGYNFNLGISKYQKVENSWFIALINIHL